jgi:hypothetical protein
VNRNRGEEINPVLAGIHLRDLRLQFPCGRTTALRGTGAVSKESGTANHAEHANGSGALQGQDDAFDLKARLAEVE